MDKNSTSISLSLLTNTNTKTTTSRSDRWGERLNQRRNFLHAEVTGLTALSWRRNFWVSSAVGPGSRWQISHSEDRLCRPRLLGCEKTMQLQTLDIRSRFGKCKKSNCSSQTLFTRTSDVFHTQKQLSRNTALPPKSNQGDKTKPGRAGSAAKNVINAHQLKRRRLRGQSSRPKATKAMKLKHGKLRGQKKVVWSIIYRVPFSLNLK